MERSSDKYSYYIKKLYYADGRAERIGKEWQEVIDDLLYLGNAIGIFSGTFEEGLPIEFISDIVLQDLQYDNSEFWEACDGKMLNLIVEEDRKLFDNLNSNADVEVRIKCSDGSLLWVSLNYRIFTFSDNERRWVCTGRILDRQLKESNVKLESDNQMLNKTITRQKIDFEDTFAIIHSIYYTILKINLTDDIFKPICIFDSRLQEFINSTSNLDELNYKYISNHLVHVDDSQDFENFANTQMLKNAFADGKEYMSHTYRKLVDGKYKYVIMEVVPSKEYTHDNQVVVLYVRDLMEESQKEIEKEERLLLKESRLNIKKSVLVVDDSKLQCSVLSSMLQNSYNVITAENGEVALKYLTEHKHDISLILLDLVMPVMDGYEFLQRVHVDLYLRTIPIIVLTGGNSPEKEEEALKLGAVDYVSKNCSQKALIYRIENAIRSHNDSVVLKTLRKDSITGTFSKEYFYFMCEQLLAKYPNESFDVICTDVEDFKIINEQYGMKIGDEILKYVADSFQDYNFEKSVYGRIDADSFGFMLSHIDGLFDKVVDANKTYITNLKEKKNALPSFVQKFGVYEDVDRSLSVSSIFDRAQMAVNKIKGMYGINVARYEDDMSRNMLKNRRILSNMEEGIRENQFQVWYQPKHDLNTGKLIGAEALVRWIHPKYGYMSPGEFIPIFEQNGFITEMDYYVWEQVCKDQRRWKDENIPIIPISINISRKDFNSFNENEKILSLIEKYELEPEEIHLEVTESAYMDNPDTVIQQVNILRENGFMIEMDDFGTGYSSLSMFGEVSVDVVKLDMGFVQNNNTQNGEQMMKYIIDMCKAMNLKVIAEGVETQDQVDRLRELGCDYVQGYYYSKPLPINEFETYLKQK